MENIKILFSGITGRTGIEVQNLAQKVNNVKIVAGICNTKRDGFYTYNQLDTINKDFDIIIDFSNHKVFDKILDFAIKSNKPLISGTSGITEKQLKSLKNASNKIAIFRGGNFRFEIEDFINAVVDYAKTHEQIDLVETHYKKNSIPTETSMTVKERVLKETGKKVNIISHLYYDDFVYDWQVESIHASVGLDGFKTLAKHLFKIAELMKGKKSGYYNLQKLIKESKN